MIIWILKQGNENNKNFKYLTSIDFNVIIDYINTFDKIEKVNDYTYKGMYNNEKIIFSIYMGEKLYGKQKNDTLFNRRNRQKKC